MGKVFSSFYRKNPQGILGSDKFESHMRNWSCAADFDGVIRNPDFLQKIGYRPRDKPPGYFVATAVAAVVAVPLAAGAGAVADTVQRFRGGGHAVASTGWHREGNRDVATFQNSWGQHWADGGTFKVDLEGLRELQMT